jgi:hypothetical protein
MSIRSAWHKVALLASGLGFLVQPCFATVYQQSERVLSITSFDHGNIGANRDSVRIMGLTSAGTCALDDGLVALVIRDDAGGERQLSILLNAVAADRVVLVTVDDTVKNASGYCFLRSVTLN